MDELINQSFGIDQYMDGWMANPCYYIQSLSIQLPWKGGAKVNLSGQLRVKCTFTHKAGNFRLYPLQMEERSRPPHFKAASALLYVQFPALGPNVSGRFPPYFLLTWLGSWPTVRPLWFPCQYPKVLTLGYWFVRLRMACLSNGGKIRLS